MFPWIFPWFSHSFPIKSPLNPIKLPFPMVFLWFSHRFSHFPYGFPMVFPAEGTDAPGVSAWPRRPVPPGPGDRRRGGPPEGLGGIPTINMMGGL